MIKLVVADAMQPYRCAGRHHEIERGAGRPSIGEWRGQPARCDLLFTDEGHAHEPARCVRLELQKIVNLVGTQIIGDVSHSEF